MTEFITDSDILTQTKKNLNSLNATHTPSIFIITGVNSVGKTTFTRELIRHLNYYQTIHLGVVSKLLKLEHGFELDGLDNNPTPEFHMKYLKLLNHLIEHYYKQGVNTLIEGVQIDPLQFENNPFITGGVILEADQETLEKFGDRPDSRLGRKLSKHQLPNITYSQTEKFIKITNRDKSVTLASIFAHLNDLLLKQVKRELN